MEILPDVTYAEFMEARALLPVIDDYMSTQAFNIESTNYIVVLATGTPVYFTIDSFYMFLILGVFLFYAFILVLKTK